MFRRLRPHPLRCQKRHRTGGEEHSLPSCAWNTVPTTGFSSSRSALRSSDKRLPEPPISDIPDFRGIRLNRSQHSLVRRWSIGNSAPVESKSSDSLGPELPLVRLGLAEQILKPRDRSSDRSIIVHLRLPRRSPDPSNIRFDAPTASSGSQLATDSYDNGPQTALSRSLPVFRRAIDSKLQNAMRVPETNQARSRTPILIRKWRT